MDRGRTRCVPLKALLLALLITAHSGAAAAYAAPPRPAAAGPCRVLVVMSYEADYAWERDIRQGIEEALGNRCDLRFFYMDTKQNLPGGEDKAKEAFALYRQYAPHGVIAADDNAQALFVVPYLRNRVNTPVIFCGVNAAPGTYGYPAENVTGVRERLHIREAIAFAQMLQPAIRKVGVLLRPTPTAAAIIEQIRTEAHSYPARVVPEQVETFSEAQAAVDAFRRDCDALYMVNLNGLRTADGKRLQVDEIIAPLARRFDKVTIGSSPFHVTAGALLTVANSGIEQGHLAAEMLLDYFGGTPLADLPITVNQKGRRIVNLRVMRSLGIKPVPAALVGVTIYDGD